MRRWMILSAAVLVGFCGTSRGDVTLPAIFGDNMVLQRDKPATLWGTAGAGEEITVMAGESKANCTADANGKWQAKLDKLAASDKPIEVTIQGKNVITLKNVLIGDVWIASGQSNMEFGLAAAKDAQTELKTADQPMIRLFTVTRKIAWTPLDEVEGKWHVCTPASARGFSAVAYFFAREIQETQKVPVGVIGTYWGGTPAQAWTSIEALRASPAMRDYVESYERLTAQPQKSKAQYDLAVKVWEKADEAWQRDVGKGFDAAMNEWKESANKAAADKKRVPPKPVPSKPRPNKPQNPLASSGQPTVLFNAMIAPLVPLSVKGFIWYQGEANAGKAAEYRTLFPLMINDWRTRFGQGDLPFLWVNLANFMQRLDQPTQQSNGWPGLREAQTLTLSLPNTAQALAIDVGDAGNIHPVDKKTVGHRLALGARAVAYGEKIVYVGPTYKSMSIDNDKVRITFGNAADGLMAGVVTADSIDIRQKNPIAVKGFAVAGQDGQFHWATATIADDSVIVTSADVPAPVAVRYGWANNPDVNLYNSQGLPAVPFRTDVDPPATQPAGK